MSEKAYLKYRNWSVYGWKATALILAAVYGSLALAVAVGYLIGRASA